MIQVPKEQRKEIFLRLQHAGIGVNVHYIPVYKHPYYQKNGYANIYCKNAEEFYSRAITLPLFVDMSEEQVEYVVEQVKLAVHELCDKSL